MIIETPRLRLRPVTDADMESFLAMAADPEVTRYVSPAPIPRASAEAAANHYRRMLETKGYGYWTIEVNGGASFAGIILLQDAKFTALHTNIRRRSGRESDLLRAERSRTWPPNLQTTQMRAALRILLPLTTSLRTRTCSTDLVTSAFDR
jgi:hypothetical protein